MAEIDIISASDRYAIGKRNQEAFEKELLPISQSGIFPAHTQIIDLTPKHTAIIQLMQTNQRISWARIDFPPYFHVQRSTSPYIAPSLGSAEKLEADKQKLDAFAQTQNENVQAQARRLTAVLTTVKETNDMIDFVKSHMLRFVQA